MHLCTVYIQYPSEQRIGNEPHPEVDALEALYLEAPQVTIEASQGFRGQGDFDPFWSRLLWSGY